MTAKGSESVLQRLTNDCMQFANIKKKLKLKKKNNTLMFFLFVILVSVIVQLVKWTML